MQGCFQDDNNSVSPSGRSFGDRIIEIIRYLLSRPLKVFSLFLSVTILYALFAYYKMSGSPDVSQRVFFACLSFLSCTPLLAIPLWFAYEYGYAPSRAESAYQKPPLYAVLIFVYCIVPVFLILLSAGISYPFLKNLVAPFLCPIGFEGADTGYFHMPVNEGAVFCTGEYGSVGYEFLVSGTAFIGTFVSVFAFVTSSLLTAARLLKKAPIKDRRAAAAIILAVYIALFGVFAHGQTKLRPYVQPINFVLNKKHYGNFLYFESSKGNVDRVRRVLDAGVDPNLKNYLGGTPIFIAVQLGKADVVELLLDHGAEAAGTDTNGKTVLDYAAEHARNGRNEFVRIIERLKHKEKIQP